MVNTELSNKALDLVAKMNDAIGKIEEVDIAKKSLLGEDVSVCFSVPVEGDTEFSDLVQLSLLSPVQLASLKEIICNMLDDTVAEARAFLTHIMGKSEEPIKAKDNDEKETETVNISAELTSEEIDNAIVTMKKKGATYGDIAKELHMAVSTVAKRGKAILDKECAKQNSK